MIRLPPFVRLVCAFALALACTAAPARLVVMHGYADYTSALVWIQAEAPGPIDVAWRPNGDDREQRLTLDAVAANQNVVVARITGLKPGAGATYRITGDGDRIEGSVRTQAFWTRSADARDFTLAIGSCFYLADPDPTWPGQDYGGGFGIFDAIAAKAPDAMLWLGDNLYFLPPDFLDPASMAERYRRQRAFAPLARLLTSTAHVAIWDDHDYGPNDADSSYVMKGAALTLFQRYWPNPSFGLPGVPGVFGWVRYGDIEVFLLDDRWYRSANRIADGPAKTMLGGAQLEWLRNALAGSRAAVKIVAAGGQFWNRASRFEGWHQFPTEQKAFAAWLLAQRIEGLVFLSGDRHFGELLKIDRPGAYPLYEFTSSPLTSGGWDKLEAPERNNPDVVSGTLHGVRQFGLVRVSGKGAARKLSLETYDTAGAQLWRRDIPLRALRFPRAGKAGEPDE